MADQSITVKVVREVDMMGLVASPLRRYFDSVLLIAYGDLAKPGRTPIDEGYLRASLQPGAGTTRVDPDDPPKWVVIGTNLGDGKEHQYPTVLEEKDWPHYRGGPSRGKPTKGWLSQTVQNVAGDVKSLQAKMAKEIKSGWRKSA